MSNDILVTVRDLEAASEETRELRDDYLVICAGGYYVAHTQVYRNGTHVVTIKRGRDAVEEE